MARILPSGRVFGEASPLPSIQFAQYEHPLKTLQDAATSDLANMAVAGISRIKDEIDYADRVHAEKSRVAGAQIAERKAAEELRRAQAAQSALQAQGAAHQSAYQQFLQDREAHANAWAERTGRPRTLGEYPGMDTSALEMEVTKGFPTPVPGERLVAASMVKEQRRRELEERLLMLESAARGIEQRTGAPASETLYGRIEQTLQDINALDSDVFPGAAPMAAEGVQYQGVIPAYQPLQYEGPAAVTDDALAAAQARIDQARLGMQSAGEAAAVPMRFVPRTKAEFDYAISQETDPARKRLLFEQSRSAVDAQPDDVMQAIAGSAGREVQEDILKRIREAGAAKSKAEAEEKKYELERRRVEAVIGANEQLEDQRRQSARKLGLEADKLGRLEERAKAGAKRGKRYAAEVASVLGIVGDAANALQAVGQAPTRGGLNAVLSPQQLNVRVEQSLAALPAKKRAEVVDRVREGMKNYGDQYDTLGAYIRSTSGGDGGAKGVAAKRAKAAESAQRSYEALEREVLEAESGVPLYPSGSVPKNLEASIAERRNDLRILRKRRDVAFENMGLPPNEQYVIDPVTGATFHVKEGK